MIIDVLINILFGIVNTILTPLGTLGELVTHSEMFLPIVDILKIIFYVLPMPLLLPLVMITCALMSFRIAIALLKTLWGILPIL